MNDIISTCLTQKRHRGAHLLDNAKISFSDITTKHLCRFLIEIEKNRTKNMPFITKASILTIKILTNEDCAPHSFSLLLHHKKNNINKKKRPRENVMTNKHTDRKSVV